MNQQCMKLKCIMCLVVFASFCMAVEAQTEYTKGIITFGLPANSTNNQVGPVNVQAINLPLSTNDIIEILSSKSSGGGGVNVQLNHSSGATVYVTNGIYSGLTSISISQPYTSWLTGPPYVNNYQFYDFVTTVRLTSSCTNSFSYTPANCVVIPSDAKGNVQIILESSSDLVNWVSSSPGTYGNTYTNRFFRVRAVAQ
jgi:hypothetical protein